MAEQADPEAASSRAPIPRRGRIFLGVMGGALAVVAGIGGAAAVDEWPWNRPEAWSFWQVESVNGTELAIRFNHGACDEYRGYTVEETPSSVTIRVRGRMNRDGDCPALLVMERERIRLRAPLGGRALFNGRSDTALPTPPTPG